MATTVDEILDDPATFVGQRVTVVGEVTQPGLIGNQAFAIEGPQTLFRVFDDDLLVVARQPISQMTGQPADALLTPGDLVQVTGTIQQLDVQQLSQILNIQLTEDVVGDRIGQPVLVLDQIQFGPTVSGEQTP